MNLLINGSATLKSTNGNFRVRFVRNDANESAIANPVENAIAITGHNADDSIMDVSGTSADVIDDTHATFAINQTNPPADATAIKTAIAYGSSKGAVGRLMTYSEFDEYRNTDSEKMRLIVRETDYDSDAVGSSDKTKTVDNYLWYWTSQANTGDSVNGINGSSNNFMSTRDYNDNTHMGIRPILLVS